MTFESLLLWTLGIGGAIGTALLVIALRGGQPSAIARAAAIGQFGAALEAAAENPPRERDDLLAAAIAAKHRGRFDDARRWLGAALASDRADGEVLVELGLVEAYLEQAGAADERLRAAIRERADLAESITLHRAFAALAGGDRAQAARFFEEVEAPLVSKLEVDVGPGEPAFAEWFLHAAALWDDAGDTARAAWAWSQAIASAPESLLPDHVKSMLGREPGTAPV
jgi:tetratricopeptide (TPR) repeat protein